MTHAYDEMYLEGAMLRMGDMLEYACLDCGYDPDCFWRMFLSSAVCKRFEVGDAAIVAGKSGPELGYLVLEEMDQRADFPEPAWREFRSDVYWSGWVLAYFQWLKKLSFQEIWDSISIRTLQKLYPTLHEADITKAVECMEQLLKPKQKQSVRGLRLIRGMTQKELARQAGMTIAQLQRIEYGERSVQNLTLKTALALAKALGVTAEELE